MRRSSAPMWVGFGTALAIVLVLGNKWVSEEFVDRLSDSPWLRGFLGGQWFLTADGRPFDLYLTINSFVVVYLIALLVLLRVTLGRVDSPVVAFTSAMGATAAAGLLGGLARGFLAVVTENPIFSQVFETDLLENLAGSVERAATFVLWSGLLVGVAAAIATAVTSSPGPAAPAAYKPAAPGAAQPPPPTGVPAPAPMPSPAPPTGDPGQPPPPVDPSQAPPPGSF